MKDKKISLFLLFLLLLLLGANFVLALEIQYPSVPGTIPPQEFLKTALPEQIPSLYVKYIFNLIIWLSGFIAFGVVLYGGIRYLTSTGKPEAIISAKECLSAGFFGLLLLLSSYFVLKTLDPQFLILKLPKPEVKKVIERPEITPPGIVKPPSSIDVEIPLGKIIEGVLEGQRLSAIVGSSQTIKEIAKKLKELNQELKEAIKECDCQETKVKSPGCTKTGNCITCLPGLPCTCDPCQKVRQKIVQIEAANLQLVSLLLKQKLILNNQIQSLMKDITRLERAEKLIQDCPLPVLSSLAGFLNEKDYFEKQKWLLFKIKYWEGIEIKGDWATFYCPVSGDIWKGSSLSLSPEEIERLLFISPPSETAEKRLACSKEVPLGEIIDRTKRTGYKLVENLEKLNFLNDQLVDAVSQMHVYVSQCSSTPCFSICFPIYVHAKCVKCVNLGCFGEPCPAYWAIGEQVAVMEEILKYIEVIVEGGEKTIKNLVPIGPVKISSGEVIAIYNQCKGEYDRLVEKGWQYWNSCYQKVNSECLEKCKDKWQCDDYGCTNECYDNCLKETETFQKFKNCLLEQWDWSKVCSIKPEPTFQEYLDYRNCRRTYENDEYSQQMCFQQATEGTINTQEQMTSCVGECVQNEIRKRTKKEITFEEQEVKALGIIPLISNKMPWIILDLEAFIRNPMKDCVAKDFANPNVFLLDCQTTITSIGPKGAIIRNCCLKEKEFDDCLAWCALEEGQAKYKNCLENCLLEKSKEKNIEEIASCRHKFNFYCCSP